MRQLGFFCGSVVVPRRDLIYLSRMPYSPKAAKLLRLPVFLPAGVLLAALLMALGLAVFPRHRRTMQRLQPPDQEELSLRQAAKAAPEDLRPRVRLARRLLAAGRFNDALDTAREARGAFPESVPVQAVLADALAATARTGEAVRVTRSLAPIAPEYRIQLALYLVRDGNREEAADLLTHLGPLSPEVALRAGVVCLDALDPDAAVAHFRTAAAARPAPPETWAHLGTALLLAGRYREAVAPLTRALDSAPDTATLHYYLGSALRLSVDPERLPEAESHLSRAVELVPEDGLFQYELALARAQLRDWEGAVSAMERAGELAGHLPEVQRDLGRLYTRLDRPRDAVIARSRYLRLVQDAPAAVSLLTAARQKDARDLDLDLALAAAHYDAGHFAQTLALLYSLRAREPRSPAVLRDLFRAEKQLEHYDRALEALAALAAVSPDDPSVSAERAGILRNLGRGAEADALLAQIRDGDPANATAHYNLGTALAQQPARPDGVRLAEASLRRAIELRPDYAAAHYQLGALLQSSGRPSESVPYLRRALDLSPEFGDALRVLGRTYAVLGDRARSEEAFRRYRALDAREQEQKRLELPGSLGHATRVTRWRLARFLVRRSDLPAAIEQLEALVHFDPEAREAHQLLARLYGNTRRLQRQFEERSPAAR